MLLQKLISRAGSVPSSAGRRCCASLCSQQPFAPQRPARRSAPFVVRASAAAIPSAAAAPEPQQGDSKDASEVSAAVVRPAAAAAAPTATTTATAATASLALKAEQLVASARGAEAALQALAASGEQCSGLLQDLRVGQAATSTDIAGLHEQLGAVREQLAAGQAVLQQELGGVREELAAARKAAAEEAHFTRLQRARVLLRAQVASDTYDVFCWHEEVDRVLAQMLRGQTQIGLGYGSRADRIVTELADLTGLHFRAEDRGEGWGWWLVLLAE
ncbi:hypothetical protein HYH02_006819 [Chlamydomonas schloesseri]|uniref:Uncharacterized protein n=1 Tax=Chlamydomonas schloesseri TaxID=2026947 RepID=A0A835WJ93_9CHLO|nr:hypothetical protein HYH02_006819 [Chlamydomonas schloesseri]|eukprot:KAG2448234.1 hypothetical protein HYH02_006819 [Chlamydomonas schloesseri]